MDVSLWNLSRVKSLIGWDKPNDKQTNDKKDDNTLHEEEQKLNKKDVFVINNAITTEQIMDEIEGSETYNNLRERFIECDPPINMFIHQNKVILESSMDNSIRYELSMDDLEYTNMIDFVFVLFDNLRHLYNSRFSIE